MPTRGQAGIFRSNINFYISLLFIASFSLGCGLILWHAAYGTNPVATMLLSTAVVGTN